MIADVNVNLSRWPFRRLRGDEPETLVRMLRERNVARAWASSFDGLLHKDLAGVNERLAADCRRWGEGILTPIGCVNPMLPDWEEDLARCHEKHRMPGIRLTPNYHGYKLDEPVFAEVLAKAGARGLVVQVALQMEDERTQHPLVRVRPVDASALVEIASRLSGLKLVILNGPGPLPPALVSKLAGVGAHFDIAMLEGVTGVARLAKQIGPERVLFGSYAPFFVWESARLKIQEAGLEPEVERAVLWENARRLMGVG